LLIRPLLTLAVITSATAGFAQGWESKSPPTPTETTATCEEGQVWDEDSAACVAIEQSSLNEDRLRDTARELAYFNRSDDALALLAMSEAPDASEVLTLTAFAHGSAGAFDTALPIYNAALAVDPDNLLARAYMGLALIALDRMEDAARQLQEIRMRGGYGSSPDQVLSTGLAAGAPVGYSAAHDVGQ